jgi:D-alanine-D-alanine ligase
VAEDGCWVERAVAERALAGEVDALPAVGRRIRETLGILLTAPVEVIFPIIHGTWGEDGSLQGLCEMLDLPYVGTGVTTSAVAMDKVAAKRILAAAGVPVVPYRAFRRERFEADPEACVAEALELSLPLFVKPAVGGSSVGVRKVVAAEGLGEALAFALEFSDEVLVEEGVDGRELECAVLGYREVQASAIGEIVPGREFYDYEDKYVTDGARLIAPAELPAHRVAQLQRLAITAFEVLGGWGMGRVDFLLPRDLDEAGEPFVNELNTLPGFTAISMYPRLWELSGLPNAELVDRLVRIAVERHRDRRRLDAGIKEWLARLG